MKVKTDPPPNGATGEASLVRGGAFFRVQKRLGLIRSNRWNLGRRIIVILAISWLPMLIMTLVFNPSGLRSFMVDYRVHSRLLIAVPVLLFGEMLMDKRFHAMFAYIRKAELLDARETAYMDDVVAGLVRLRDSFLPEIIILGLIIVRIATAYRGLVDTTAWMGQATATGYQFTAAGRYGVFIGAPVWDFLFGLGLWRWLMWTYFAFKLSRRNLKLIATHPDKRGGLGFLGLTVVCFAPIAFAACSVIGSAWRHAIVEHGASLMSFKLSGIILALIVFLVALGPLIFFVPRLTALRSKGVLEYGVLGQLHSAEFEDRWVEHPNDNRAEFLRAPEINTLSGFGNTYEKIGDLKPFPADLISLYGLIAAVALPALFVVVTKIPLVVVLKELLTAVH